MRRLSTCSPTIVSHSVDVEVVRPANVAFKDAGGDADNSTVQFEYKEIRETIQIEKEVLRETCYLDFFRTKGNRWRLAILISLGIISQYSGNALFSNYINLIYEGAGITSQSQKIAVCLPCPVSQVRGC